MLYPKKVSVGISLFEFHGLVSNELQTTFGNRIASVSQIAFELVFCVAKL